MPARSQPPVRPTSASNGKAGEVAPASVFRSQVSGLRFQPRSLVIAAGRPAAVVAFESDLVDFFAGAAELLGVPKSLAAIYGIVFASPTPLSFADIAMRLDLSNGSVSQGLRALREVGAVQEVSRKEDPAELFVPDLEMRRLIERYLSGRLDPQLKRGREYLGSLETRLEALSAADRKQLTPRLQKLRRWHSRSQALLPMIRTFLRLTGRANISGSRSAGDQF